jgi:hypothetical protein
VKHLAQSLRSLLIEGSVDGVRAIRASLERLGKAFLIEFVDGVAHLLTGYSQGCGRSGKRFVHQRWREQDLATTQGEGLGGERNPASRVLRSASVKGRTKIGSFME